MEMDRMGTAVLLAALREPVSLLIIGGTAFVAWYYSFWWAICLGLALVLMFIFRRIDDPVFRREVAARQRGLTLAALKRQCDREQTKALAVQRGERLRNVIQIKDDIWRKFRTSPPLAREVTYQIAYEALRAVRWYCQLAAQQVEIAAELKGQNRFKLEAEVYELEQQATREQDPALRDGLQRTAKFKREALHALNDLAAKARTIETRLMALEAALSGVRVRLANASLADIHEFDGELEALAAELTALEGAIDEVNAVAPEARDR